MQCCMMDEEKSISTLPSAIQDKERHERLDKIRPSVRPSLLSGTRVTCHVQFACHSLQLFTSLPLLHNLNVEEMKKERKREEEIQREGISGRHV
jgi:hypothetical protein